jgi:peroxiredoxin Q/BCP
MRGTTMSELTSGELAPQFSLPAIDGSTFNMADVKGKRVILTFFRFSSCPLCNMRIRRIIQRWDEFSDDAVMVAVFDAKLGELQKRMKKHNAPFVVVADETYEQFRKNGVKKSFFKFLWGAMRSPLTLLQATLRGYVPLTMSIAKLSTIPVDVLIDEAGNVVEAHYCKDTADHLSLEKMIAFSHGA